MGLLFQRYRIKKKKELPLSGPDWRPESYKRLTACLSHTNRTNIQQGLWAVDINIKNTKNYADASLIAVFDCWETACAFRAMLEFIGLFKMRGEDGKEISTKLVIMKTKISKYTFPELENLDGDS